MDFAKNKGAKILDLRFMDFPGLWQHLSVPIGELSDELFTDGHGFDGSSIRGWQAINASDMLIIPDPDSARIDPFLKDPTLVMICDVVDPITRENYSRDPRNIAKKAEAFLKATGIADVAYFGPEAEFFVFDDIRSTARKTPAYYYVDSSEGQWNTGRAEGPNLGYKPRYKEVFPVPPMDSQQDIRSEMVLLMEEVGIRSKRITMKWPRPGRRKSICV
jgi:glutamine synthetase